MKLSIITINYNNANGLQRTIESIVNQKCNDFEYIVIDGASTDGGVKIIESYEDKIDYWISEPDKGIFNAMNKGIARAKGEYLLFMNSGDIIQESVNMNEIIEELNTGDDIIAFDIDIKGDGFEYINTHPKNADFLFFTDASLAHQSTFIKREKLVAYNGYDESMAICSDWIYFMDAICLQNQSYRSVNKVFTTFFADGISSKKEYNQQSLQERKEHINKKYTQYLSLYNEFLEQKKLFHKLRMAVSIDFVKKLGFLKWFGTYKQPLKHKK